MTHEHRPNTIKDDLKILTLVDSGNTPKQIKAELKLQNVMRVYNAIRRRKINLQNIAKDCTC